MTLQTLELAQQTVDISEEAPNLLTEFNSVRAERILSSSLPERTSLGGRGRELTDEQQITPLREVFGNSLFKYLNPEELEPDSSRPDKLSENSLLKKTVGLVSLNGAYLSGEPPLIKQVAEAYTSGDLDQIMQAFADINPNLTLQDLNDIKAELPDNLTALSVFEERLKEGLKQELIDYQKIVGEIHENLIKLDSQIATNIASADIDPESLSAANPLYDLGRVEALPGSIYGNIDDILNKSPEELGIGYSNYMTQTIDGLLKNSDIYKQILADTGANALSYRDSPEETSN